MRLPLAVFPLVLSVPGAAQAHVGHLGDMAGHDHWVAGAAIGVAIALGLWAGLKGKRDDDAGDAPDEETVRDSEAEA